jgi:hypothetical protein
MIGARSRLSLVILFVPACLLAISAAVRASLMQPWTVWRPPILDPWHPGAQPPPPERVGHTLLGGRLYAPSTVLARARFTGNLAMATLAIALLPALVFHRFSLLVVRPSPWAAWVCAAARWMLRGSPLLAVLYLGQIVAIVYFGEVLASGGATFVTPACILIILFATAAYLFRRWQSPAAETAPPRVNGRPLERAREPELFAALDDAGRCAAGAAADRVLATLQPPIALAEGPLQCGDLIEGHILLVPLPLCAILSVEELRALAAEQLAPLGWHGGPYAERIFAVHREAQTRMARLAPPDTAFGRLSFILPGIAFCILALLPAEDVDQLSADATAESDRIAAARFGTVDLARGLLKSYLALALWPRFHYEMAAELKSWQRAPQPHPYEFIGRRFPQYLTPERVSPILATAPADLRDRLARFGQTPMMELDFLPAEPALGLLREADAIDRELSAAERARVVFERSAAPA